MGLPWVARGSMGRSRVADFSSRSGNSRVGDPHRFGYIPLYSITVWPATRADPRRGAQKIRARSLRGERGFEVRRKHFLFENSKGDNSKTMFSKTFDVAVSGGPGPANACN